MEILETDRLLLRPFSVDDFEAHYAIVGSDPKVTWDHTVSSREQAYASLESKIRHWREHGFGMWVVIERATGQLLGHGGLQHFEQPDAVELGYYLGQPAWGRGFATELGRAALEYGFARLQLPEIVAVARPENQGSQRVLAKLGFKYSHTAYHYGFDVLCFRLNAIDHQRALDARQQP